MNGDGARRWVLVTDGAAEGQSRSTLAAVRALAGAGYAVAVTVSGRRSLAAAARGCARAVPVPAADQPGYAEAVAAEVARRAYVTVMPASDAALVALGLPGHDRIAKDVLADRAAAVGLPAVPSRRFDSAEELRAAARTITFPAVVKPTLSRSPARLLSGAAELDAVQGPGPYLVQPYLSGQMRAVGGVVRAGRLVGAVHQSYLRTWPVRCGTSCAAVTTAPDPASETALVALLDGYDGIFQAQFRDGHLLDLNVRVYGSLPLAVASGVNLAALHCAVVTGEDPPLRRARPGVAYRWLEGDLRHVAAQMRAGRLSLRPAWSALRPRRGTVHSVLSVRDPRPGLARLRYVLQTVRS